MSKILFIEDDLLVQFSLRKLLECFGYEVITANNGKEGFLEYQKNSSQIDIIICDIDMPTFDGFQFLEKIKIFYKKIPPFAFISAYTDDKIIQKVHTLNADCVIKKPIDQKILKTILLALQMKHF